MHTSIRRVGRIRTLVGLAACAAFTIAAAPVDAPGTDDAPGLHKTVDARNSAPAGPWAEVDTDADADSETRVSPQGWTWR